MSKKPYKILAINPGSRYIGTAVFNGPKLLNWRVKVIKDRRPKGKWEKIRMLVDNLIVLYQPDALAIKQLHRSRSSRNLNLIVSRLRQFSKRKGLRLYQYPIKKVEAFFSPGKRINKKRLAEILTSRYPELLPEFRREKASKNPYHIRVFEAVALGAVCLHQLDKN
jgi:hypothetical protein